MSASLAESMACLCPAAVLPIDDFCHYPDPSTWPSIDNGTCCDMVEEPPYEWQKRALYALLVGTMKGGTHALSDYLWQHPLIAPMKHCKDYKLHFFDGKHFIKTKMAYHKNKIN